MNLRNISRVFVIAVVTVSAASCFDDEGKVRFPDFIEGVNFRAIPSPWTARPRLSGANPENPITFKMTSLTENSIAKVDIYVSYLPNTNMPANVIAANTTYANAVGPIRTENAIPEVPDSGTFPVIISYTAYNVLINGSTTTNPPVVFTPISRVLLKSLNAGSIVGDHSFTLTELVNATGAVLPANLSTLTVPSQQPVFLFTFEVTDLNGMVFSYRNGSPATNVVPPTGRVAIRTWVNPSGGANKVYQIILDGEQGAEFVPGASVRVGP
jgi:hypothetical protein